MGLQDFSRRIKLATERYLKRNWGLPFIACFILLLLSAAILLAAGLAPAAEAVANVAYFALAAGVLIELLCIGRHKHKDE